MRLIFINGFLGSGKTTMVNYLLHQNEKVGVIVNDFGDVNVDAGLMESNAPMIQIENGSIFCSCNSHQFVESLIKMAKEDLNYLIVESSGFSNPGSLNLVVSQLKELGQLDYQSMHKVTIVDPILFNKTKSLLPVQRQVEVADILVINKVDLAHQEKIDQLAQQLSIMNSEAKIIQTQYGKLELQEVVNNNYHSKFISKETSRDISFSSISIPINNISVDKRDVIDALNYLKDKVYRIKGFMIVDNQKSLVELASQQISLSNVQNEEELVLVVLYSTRNIGKKEILNKLSFMPNK